jgi:crotonobetaine/carnitine-CoA ligase
LRSKVLSEVRWPPSLWYDDAERVELMRSIPNTTSQEPLGNPYLDRLTPPETTIVQLLERRAASDPDAPFFTWGDEADSVASFNARANMVARNLQALGVTSEDRIAVLMGSSPDYLALWFAIGKLGAVEIPINTAYHGEMLRHQLANSGARFCVVDAEFAAPMRELVPRLPQLQTVVVRPDGSRGVSAHAETNFAVLLKDNDTENLGIEIPHDSLSTIIYTSGTTGQSKGVLMTHHYLAAYGCFYAGVNGLTSSDVILNYLPFFHVGAKFLTIAALVSEGRMRLVPRLSVTSLWEEVRTHGVTNFVAVGGVCNMLLAKPPQPDDADNPLRSVYAVPDPVEIHEAFETRFGCRMTTVYGSTEVCVPIIRTVDDEYRPGSCGRLNPYFEVKIVDEHDNEVPVGTSGEIVVRSHRPYMLASGYNGLPEMTVQAWRNLWFHTGDRGRVDADGWFWFDDRLTDSLRRRGENISSYEVEQLVVGHPAVAEAAAVASPSELGEDEVRVAVVLREGMSVDFEELFLYCAKVMPYFMVPRFIDIVDDLPRTPTAKVEKYKLREQGLGAATWDAEKAGWRMTRQGPTRLS